MTSTPKRFSSIIDKWGADTKDPTTDGRKIAVSKFDPRLTLKELLEHFGTESRVDGITLFRKGFAIVQFKRPQDYTKALTFNETYINRDLIRVEPYRSQASFSQRRNHASPPDRPVEPRRRSRSRSGGRSRSRSPSTTKSPSNAKSPSRKRSPSTRKSPTGRKSPGTNKSPRNRDEHRNNGSSVGHEKGRERGRDRERERERDRDREERERGRRSPRRRSRTPGRRSKSPNRNKSPVKGWEDVREDRSLVSGENREKISSIGQGRSRSRSRSHSPANRTDYRNNPVTFNLLDQGPENMASLLMNYNLETRARGMQTTFGGSNNQARTTFQSPLVVNQPPGAIAMDPSEKDLPSEVELILKLVIEQGTARKLSLANIQNVLNYFESTKLIIIAMSRPVPLTDTHVQLQQPISGSNVQPNQVICNNGPPSPKAPSSNHSQSQSYSKNTDSNDANTSGSNTTTPLLEKLKELNRYNNKKLN